MNTDAHLTAPNMARLIDETCTFWWISAKLNMNGVSSSSGSSSG